jgi:hypothetical protein
MAPRCSTTGTSRSTSPTPPATASAPLSWPCSSSNASGSSTATGTPIAPATVLEELNRGLFEECRASGLFVTVTLALVDTISCTVSLSSAGHPPVLVVRGSAGSGPGERLEKTGPALGLTEAARFEERPGRAASGRSTVPLHRRAHRLLGRRRRADRPSSAATFIAVEGRAIWKHAPTLRDACLQSSGEGKRAVIDLGACAMLDSTVLGTLHELATTPGIALSFQNVGADLRAGTRSRREAGCFERRRVQRLVAIHLRA